MTRRELAMAALPAALAAGATSASAQSSTQGLTTLITGLVTTTGAALSGGTLSGVLNITSFAVQNGVLNALGTLTTTLTDAAGNVLPSVTQAIALPVGASGSCTILTLTLGPLDLNLLGLMVHLNQVVLNITAQQGPGNLLGNLLCGVANLLNSNGALAGLLNALAGALNNILSHL